MVVDIQPQVGWQGDHSKAEPLSSGVEKETVVQGEQCGQDRGRADPPRCPGGEVLSTAGLLRGACEDSRPQSQPWGGQSRAGSASSFSGCPTRAPLLFWISSKGALVSPKPSSQDGFTV